MKNNGMKIAVAGIQTRLGEFQLNIKKMTSWTEKAVDEKVDLICFPELCITGFASENYETYSSLDMQKMLDVADYVPDGKMVEPIVELAKELEIYICAGILEKQKGKVYNTQVLVGPDNFFVKYRKIHTLFKKLSCGNDIPVFNINNCNIGITQCWENLFFPETVRILAIKGADIILHPAGPRRVGTKTLDGEDRDMTRYRPEMLGLVRSLENSVFVVGCSPECSYIADPKGRLVAKGEKWAVADCNLELRDPWRLSLRKPEVYQILYSKAGAKNL